MINSPYKAYKVYIWDEKYATIVYALSPSKAKAKYYSDGEFSLDFFDAIRQMVVKRVKEMDGGCKDLDETLEYVNQRYGKSFRVGQLVKANGSDGWIIQGRGGYVVVGHGDSRDHVYHPNDVVSCVKAEV